MSLYLHLNFNAAVLLTVGSIIMRKEAFKGMTVLQKVCIEEQLLFRAITAHFVSYFIVVFHKLWHVVTFRQ